LNRARGCKQKEKCRAFAGQSGPEKAAKNVLLATRHHKISPGPCKKWKCPDLTSISVAEIALNGRNTRVSTMLREWCGSSADPVIAASLAHA
jgi:hypothetical protein